MNFSLYHYLELHISWSKRTFGLSRRTRGITEHIRNELDEIEGNPDDVYEWIDVVILALDGAWRAGYTTEEILDALCEKQRVNFGRRFPLPESDDQPSFHIGGRDALG